MECLGHLIIAKGIQIDPIRVEAMATRPRPTSIKALWGLQGLTATIGNLSRDKKPSKNP